MNRNHILCHDFADRGIPLAEQHFPYSNNTKQLLSGIRHITGIEVLTILSVNTDPADCLHDRHGRKQPDILGRHYGTGTVLRIFQKSIDILPVFRTHFG